MRHLLNTLFVTTEDAYLCPRWGEHRSNPWSTAARTISAPHAQCDYLFFLCRGFARLDGCLCSAEYQPYPSAPREVDSWPDPLGKAMAMFFCGGPNIE